MADAPVLTAYDKAVLRLAAAVRGVVRSTLSDNPQFWEMASASRALDAILGVEVA